MPRPPRPISCTGFYHITLRGNGKQILFETDSDRFHLLDGLKESLGSLHIRLIAWCLMENHVHLIIDDPENNISQALQKATVSYANYYNTKYEHCGHVFQGRYGSSAIEKESYLLEAIRYVIRNPEKAGVARANKYRWSSYAEVVDETLDTYTAAEFVRELFGGERGFSDFINSSRPSDYAPLWSKKVDDFDAAEIAKAVCIEEGLGSPSEIKTFAKEKRNRLLRALADKRLTAKQIERLTGIGRGAISNACGKNRRS